MCICGYIYNSNYNRHNIYEDDINEIKFVIAEKYGTEFFEAFKEYYKHAPNVNVVDIIDSANKLMEIARNNEELSANLGVVAFLTATIEYTADSKTCGEIAKKLAGTKIGEKEIVNLPTYYKFFKRAFDRNLTVTLTTHLVREE